MAGRMGGQNAAWSLPRVGTREHDALSWLATIKAPPRTITLAPSLWVPAARVSGLSVPRVKRLARRAADADDPRVAWYAEHRARLRRRTRRGPTDMARARMANWLRKRGLRWKRIARLCGYSDSDNGATARKMAAVYRERLADGGTLPKARIAYKRREHGEPWAQIARRAGYASSRSARVMARRYAKRAGKPWPVPLLQDGGAARASGARPPCGEPERAVPAAVDRAFLALLRAEGGERSDARADATDRRAVPEVSVLQRPSNGASPAPRGRADRAAPGRTADAPDG